jgi:hypothetical protein
MTIMPPLLLAIVFIGTVNVAYAHPPALSESDIPWGMLEDHYINKDDFDTATTSGKVHTYQAKITTKINNTDFTKTVKFIDKKGLSQIAYITNPKNEEFENICALMQDALNKIYRQRTNEVHVRDQGSNNYTEVIWTSKLDRIVRLFCFQAQDTNVVAVSLFPRWIVLDCTMHPVDPNNKKVTNRRAFFYFDPASEEIRFFNNEEVSLPFTSTFSDSRIAFSHNNADDHTTIDLNTRVIMSKFVDENGKSQLLVGKCKTQ